jgi:hypothetical protein
MLIKRGDEIKKISSPLKLPSQSQPNFAEMIFGWSPSKIVSGISDIQSRWPPQPSFLAMYLQLKFELILTYTKAAMDN